MKMTALQDFLQLLNDLLQDQLICWCKRAHLQNIKKIIHWTVIIFLIRSPTSATCLSFFDNKRNWLRNRHTSCYQIAMTISVKFLHKTMHGFSQQHTIVKIMNWLDTQARAKNTCLDALWLSCLCLHNRNIL